MTDLSKIKGLMFAPSITLAADDGHHTNDLSEHHFNEGTLIMIRTKGEVVEAIQQKLSDEGIATNVDGDFGPSTKNSVELFQNNRELHVDGVLAKKHGMLYLKTHLIQGCQ